MLTFRISGTAIYTHQYPRCTWFFSCLIPFIEVRMPAVVYRAIGIVHKKAEALNDVFISPHRRFVVFGFAPVETGRIFIFHRRFHAVNRQIDRLPAQIANTIRHAIMVARIIGGNRRAVAPVSGDNGCRPFFGASIGLLTASQRDCQQ